jgi:hypothetical protein
MKLNKLITQLKALKTLHGNLDVKLVNSDTGYLDVVTKITTSYPLGKDMCADFSKPVNSVVINTY